MGHPFLPPPAPPTSSQQVTKHHRLHRFSFPQFISTKGFRGMYLGFEPRSIIFARSSVSNTRAGL